MASASDTYQASSNPMECDICCNVFSEDHCPRILPCSHSLCGRCIDELIETQKKECPVCKTSFTAASSENVMINRGLLDAAKHLSSMHLASVTLSRAPKKPFIDTNKYFRVNVIEKGIAICEETAAEVNDRIESNNKMVGELEGFVQTLDEMKLSTRETLRNIARDNKLLSDKMDMMKGKLQPMKDLEDKLEAATDFASAAGPMDEADKCFCEVKKMANEIKRLLQENKDNMKQDTLRIEGTFTEAMKDLGRITEELEGDSIVSITVTDLRSPHGRLRGDAQREIFAVMTFEGKLRLAPVKIESNNQVSFTHLEEGVLPPRCFVIELESLIPGGGSPSPPLSHPPPRGFLDLAYGPTPLGRVIIRVTVDGLKGRNFLLMCAGGIEGDSYAHSRVSRVWNKGRAGERIVMGEYQPHGGGGGGGGTTSTRAVLPSREEDWERERESGTYEETPYKAGDVRGFISYEEASEFWIVTRDDPNWRLISCFGMVEKGLDVLKSAISKYEDIEQVEVANCGLIL